MRVEIHKCIIFSKTKCNNCFEKHLIMDIKVQEKDKLSNIREQKWVDWGV